MIYRRVNLNRLGSSFMEYAVVLGLVSLVLTGMNIYIKRGMQGRIKEMTDNFIGKEQAANSYPTATVVSQSNIASASGSDAQEFIGGSRFTYTSNTISAEAISTTVDTAVLYFEETFVPAEAGQVDVSQSGEEQTSAAAKGSGE